MAVECFAVLELDQHRVALRRVQKPEGQLSHRSVTDSKDWGKKRQEQERHYHLESSASQRQVCCLSLVSVFRVRRCNRWDLVLGKLQTRGMTSKVAGMLQGHRRLTGPHETRLKWSQMILRYFTSLPEDLEIIPTLHTGIAACDNRPYKNCPTPELSRLEK